VDFTAAKSIATGWSLQRVEATIERAQSTAGAEGRAQPAVAGESLPAIETAGAETASIAESVSTPEVATAKTSTATKSAASAEVTQAFITAAESATAEPSSTSETFTSAKIAATESAAKSSSAKAAMKSAKAACVNTMFDRHRSNNQQCGYKKDIAFHNSFHFEKNCISRPQMQADIE
jgi:hypothetical protein